MCITGRNVHDFVLLSVNRVFDDIVFVLYVPESYDGFTLQHQKLFSLDMMVMVTPCNSRLCTGDERFAQTTLI